jgi:hypothetical protein
MNDREYLEKNAPRITEIISPTTSLETPKREVVANHNSGIELLSIGIVSIVGLYFLFRTAKSGQKKDNDNNSLNVFQKIAPPSCKKCRFFNDNFHLKCAVHPVRVGNVKAKDCSDYWQRDRASFWHR